MAARESAEAYALGVARARIDCLRFESGVRDYDEKNIDRIEKIFEVEGCLREDPMHYIPALISSSEIDASVLNSDQPKDLQVTSGRTILALHGKHRIVAAQHFLPKGDQWWTVALYDTSLPIHLRQSIIEEYKNELRFSDGDVFRFYRRAQKSNDQRAVRRWLARLSKTKKRNLMQLEKADHGRIVSILDNLLPYAGLWQGFHLGALNSILPMRMWEEILCYLQRLLEIWRTILGDSSPSQITPGCVLELQLRIPALSCSDQKAIKGAFRQLDGPRYKLFPAVSDALCRQVILDRLLRCGRILSFQSFFDDVLYLEVLHCSMRRLLLNRRAYSESFAKGFEHIYSGPPDLLHERYLSIVLYVMRFFPQLSDLGASQPRKEKSGSKPVKGTIDLRRQHAFSNFAKEQGFSVCGKEDSDKGFVETLSDILPSLDPPALTSDIVGLPMKARSNRPFGRSFITDRKFLFIQHIKSSSPPNASNYPTTFAVAQDFVNCFWGKYLNGSLNQQENNCMEGDLPTPVVTRPSIENEVYEGLDEEFFDLYANSGLGSAAENSAAATREEQAHPSTQIAGSPGEISRIENHSQQLKSTEDGAPATHGAQAQPVDQVAQLSQKRQHADDSHAQPEMQLARFAESWCIIDPDEESYTGALTDELRFNNTLNHLVQPEHSIHVVDSGIPEGFRCIGKGDAFRGMLALGRPYTVRVVKKSRRPRNAKKQVHPWDQIKIRTDVGQNMTLSFNMTGNHSQKVLAIMGDDKEFEELPASIGNRIKYIREDSGDNEVRITLVERNLAFYCLKEDWNKFTEDDPNYASYSEGRDAYLEEVL